MEDGLYEIHFHTVHGIGTGVIYAVNGKLRGGNSAFAFTGNFQNKGDTVSVMVSTKRYNTDQSIKSLFGFEGVTLSLTGRACGDMLTFEGHALQLPGVKFNAELSRICD